MSLLVRTSHGRGALVALATMLGACSRMTNPVAESGDPVARVQSGSLPGVPGVTIYGVGGNERANGQQGCTAARFHQFDFWLGDWSVNPTGAGFAAINPVTAELDGCVLEEHWAPVAGLPGRSLSSYDDLTGRWRQTWVTAAGRPIRMDGGLRPDGVMEMAGVRIHWFFGYHFMDTYTWTKVDADHVIQRPLFDLPELTIHITGELNYTRVAPLPTVALNQGTRCQPGGDTEETRNLDFLQGDWLVRSDAGGALGHSRIAIDHSLSDCLLEESFSGSKRYRAIGWLYFDPIVNRYFRTYVDNGGNRLEMDGGYANGRLTLTGSQQIPGAADTRVRLVWEPIQGGLRQTWERSDDAGQTWTPIEVLRFTPDDGA